MISRGINSLIYYNLHLLKAEKGIFEGCESWTDLAPTNLLYSQAVSFTPGKYPQVVAWGDLGLADLEPYNVSIMDHCFSSLLGF